MPSSSSRAAQASPTAARLLRRSRRAPPLALVAPALTLARARHTAACVDLLADLAERLPSEVRRALTLATLEAELGRALARLARDVAARHLRDETDPPDEPSVFARVVRAQYARLVAARDATAEDEADRRLAAL